MGVKKLETMETPRRPTLDRKSVYMTRRKIVPRSPREEERLNRKLDDMLKKMHEKRLAWQKMSPRAKRKERQRVKQEKKAVQVFAQETRRQARALGAVRKKKKEKMLVSVYELLNALQKATPNRQRAVTGSTTVGSYLKGFKIHSKRVVQLIDQMNK